MLYFYEVQAPVKPTNVAITLSGTDVMLTWDAVAGATSYKIYFSNEPDGNFEEDLSGVFEQETWTAQLPQSTIKYFYYVTALSD